MQVPNIKFYFVTDDMDPSTNTDTKYSNIHSLLEYNNKTTKKNYVFVENSETDFEDKNYDCIFTPDKVKCNSLVFAFGALIEGNLHWIDTINIVGNIHSKQPLILDIQEFSNMRRSIRVKCHFHCEISSPIFISVQNKRSKVLIVFENLEFVKTVISLSNVDIHFNNVTFYSTSIVDFSPPWSSVFSQMYLKFTEVSFSKLEETGDTMSLTFDKTFNVRLEVTHSKISSLNLLIKTENAWVETHDTLFIQSFVRIGAYNLLNINISSVKFEDSFLVKSEREIVTLYLLAKILFVHMSDVSVINTTGIVLEKVYSGLLQSWIEVIITNSHFSNNTKKGLGGAIFVKFNVPYLSLANSFNVYNSTFYRNTVYRNNFVSAYGGAIYVSSAKDIPLGSTPLMVQIEHSRFANNFAEDAGGALYVSGEHIETNISSSNFQMTTKESVSPNSIFIGSTSSIVVEKSNFLYNIETGSVSLLDFQMKFDEATINNLQLSIECLPGHKLSQSIHFRISPSTGNKVLQKYVSTCVACTPSFYVATDGIYNVSFSPGDLNVKAVDQTTQSEVSSCLSCPYGGDCSGSIIKSKPNFWGLRQNNEIQFLQCPSGLCCEGSGSSPCVSYDTCSGHRMGYLCGACKEGYTLSILSNDCVHDTKCNASWFWIISIVSVTGYMLWYTFKEDIMNIPAQCLRKITPKRHKTSGWFENDENIDKGYFEIFIYFVQAAAVMKLSLNLETNITGSDDAANVKTYTELLLSFELSSYSLSLCPIKQLNSVSKMAFTLNFLFGIFISWAVVVLVLTCMTKIPVLKSCMKKHNGSFSVINSRFSTGFIEIAKYTYSGFTNVAFMCVTCVTVRHERVWWYDGTVNCLTGWQIAAVVFIWIYVIPFPVILIWGPKLLQQKLITKNQFFTSCIIPLLFLCLWTIRFLRKGESKNLVKNKNSDVIEEIIGALQGPYRETDGIALYWESVMIFRRLLLGATVLIPNPFFHLSVCCILCMVFLTHHIYKQPFLHRLSNLVETFSLCLLCFVAMMNLTKSIYINMGSVPEGPDVSLFNFLKMAEYSLILLLIGFTLVLEISTLCVKKPTKVDSLKPGPL